jgi:hypothetical protein
MMMSVVDPAWKSLYRVGGISALLIGIAYVAIIGLYIPIGAPPAGTEARLTYLSGNTMVWWAILRLSVLTDFLFVPLACALYLALKEINRSAMLIATACVALFVVLDLTLTWANYAALIAFSHQYANVTNAAQRVALVTAANYPSAILESNLLFVYNTLTLSVGILLTGFVMREGIFGRSMAYLGMATGIVGTAAVMGSFFVNTQSATIIASILTTVWVLFVGYRLYRLTPDVKL